MKIEVVQVCRLPRWLLWAVLLVSVWLALGGACVWLSSHLDRPVSLCLFKRVTGLPCPTCGFTRGALCFLRGRPDQAWLYNPLLFFALTLFVVAVTTRILFAKSLRIHLTRVERVFAWFLGAGLFAANWAYVIFYIG